MAHLNDECRAKVRYYFVTALFKTREFWSTKPNWRLRFSLPSIILADLLGNCVSVFQGWLLVIVIIVDGSEKPNCEDSFWTFTVRVFVKSTVNTSIKFFLSAPKVEVLVYEFYPTFH